MVRGWEGGPSGVLFDAKRSHDWQQSSMGPDEVEVEEG